MVRESLPADRFFNLEPIKTMYRNSLSPPVFPVTWASDWGEDQFGLWMAFTLKGVRQAFRWCEPGTFLMGSPEDEPGRDDDETLHEVTLTPGVLAGGYHGDPGVLAGGNGEESQLVQGR
jgi:hypothetical protein